MQGEGRVGFRREAGTTRLATLYQHGAVKIRMPRRQGANAEAILVNTSGGLAGGDAIAVDVSVGPGASATVTTQACERVYRTLGPPASVAIRLSVGAGGRLDWLPQETILFDRSALRRRIEVDLGEGATLLAVEAAVFGRAAMGEVVGRGCYRDRWRVRRNGRLLYADDIAIDGPVAETLVNPAVLGGAAAMATLLYVGDDAEDRIERLRDAVGVAGGASAWNGRLVARLVGADAFALRRHLIPAVAALRGDGPLPKVWLV